MAIYKAQISVQVDTALPRDAMVITPHFNVSGASPTPLALATALGDNLGTWLTTAPPITVKIYDTAGSPPHFPLATYNKNPAGAPIVSSYPREVALCLSYYETNNQPGRRGRLYIPFSWVMKATGGTGTPAMRPTASQQNSVKLLGHDVLAAVGPSGAQWGFMSVVSHTFRSVTNYWVDDEWDIIRKRGLKSTSRVTATVP